MLSQLSPEVARMLDEQSRQKALQQQLAPTDYGNSGMGMFLSAASGAQKSLGAGASNLVNQVNGVQAPMGMEETRAVESQKNQQVVTDALSQAKGATQSARLLNAAERLEKSNNPNAIAYATQLRTQAGSIAVQEQTLDLQKQRLSIDKTEAENRADEFKQRQASTLAGQELQRKQLVASTTVQETVVDSEGNRFQQITGEDGSVNFSPIAGAPSTPVGNISTINEIVTNQQNKTRFDLQFNGAYIEERKAVQAQLKDTRAVFNSADNAYGLLKELQKAGGTTGGVVTETERKIKRYLGIEDNKTIKQEPLKKELGMAIAANLKATFGGSQITDSERKFLEANMISILDTPEVILEKLGATMEVSKKGVAKLTDLFSAKGYSELTELQGKYMEQDYLDVKEKYELNFEQPTASTDQITPEMAEARRMMAMRNNKNVSGYTSVRNIRNR